MPKQHVILGRPIPRLRARRVLLLLLSFLLLAVFLCWKLATRNASAQAYDSDVHASNGASSKLGRTLSQPPLGSLRQLPQPPSRQKNDTFAGSAWWADSQWLAVPFSSTITLDDRTLLPPLARRPRIYCYYDNTLEKPREEKDAESELLLTWERAWWSRGFRPMILSAAEATNNPAYAELEGLDMGAELRADIMRWLAWDTVGGGLLTHYTLLPVGLDVDDGLSPLRNGELLVLTKWQELGSGLFAGPASDVSALIRMLAKLPLPENAKEVVTAVPGDLFTSDPASLPLAYYSTEIVEWRYTQVGNTLAKDRAKGLRSLNALINSHLHIIWQNSFPEGIQVPKPLPQHTTALVGRALKVAQSLAACADSPMPATCPPNVPRCTPCVAMSPMSVTTPSQYKSSKRLYTIGTVPHPWTLALLHNVRDSLDISWIRGESERDPWLTAVTQRLLGTGVSSNLRVLRLKEAVASDAAARSSLWFTAESEINIDDLGWHFGFAVPTKFVETGRSLSPVPADRLVKANAKEDRENGPVASDDEVAQETVLLSRARAVVARTKATTETSLRASLEAWNLADTEAWKFVRAYQSRRHMERDRWYKDES